MAAVVVTHRLQEPGTVARAQLIDLSMSIEANPADPTLEAIRRVEHRPGGNLVWRSMFCPPKASLARRIKGRWRYRQVRGDLNNNSFPDGLFLSNEIYTLSVHCGTHLDAPYHFGPTCEGRPARCIDEVPLDWCFGPAVVLDLSAKGPSEPILAVDVERALERTGHELQAGDLVLIRTDSDLLWPSSRYFTEHPGMTEKATRWLVERGVKVIGIDTNGFDLPFPHMMNEYLRTRDRNVLWPAHMYGRHHEYVHIERLANLRKLPRADGFHLACFPVSVEKAGAAWVRAVAIV